MMDNINAIDWRSRDEIQKYIIICLSLAILFSCAQYLWKRRYLYIHSWSVEGPLALPLIGCAYMFLGKSTPDILNNIMEMQDRSSTGLLKVWIGPKLMYFISEPEYIKTVLNHPKALEKEPVYKIAGEAIGDGLLTASVKKWKYHKKLIAPSFNQKILDTFVEVFAEAGTILSEKLETVVGQKDFDLYQFVSKCTLDIICQTAMGVNMNFQKKEENYGALLERCSEIVSIRIFKVLYQLNLFWKFTTEKKVLEETLKVLHDLCATIVSKKIEAYEKQVALQQSFTEAEIEEEPVRKRLAFFDMILKKSLFTKTELQDEVTIFMTAGSETSASSMCFLFTILGMHPEIQQKLYEEVIDILGPDRTVKASDLPKMKYTETVIKENLRLFPIGGIFGRLLEGDIDLGDVILPAGSSTAFNTIQLHRNPKYWTNPLKFDPDRFLPEEVAKRHPCTYIPFSYGSRNCIGWRYAIANMKTLIAILIRKYRIFTEYKTIEDINLKLIPLLRMEDGPKVWIEYR